MIRFVLSIAAIAALAVPAAAQNAALDGTYVSSSGPVAGNPACGTSKFNYPLRVSGGSATLQTVSSGQLSGAVAADGSLTLTGGGSGGVLKGKITGRHFSGSYQVNRCLFALEYDKR